VSAPDLLVVIDPVARATDGESVRIARDVLCAGAPGAKVCLPEDPEEAARLLARRGSRRPVVVGDDRALLRTVQLLHRDRELAACGLAVVPVGPVGGVALARALGVPTTAVAASRAVLCGRERPMDLLVDDSGGVVLGSLGVPAGALAGSDALPGARGAPDDGLADAVPGAGPEGTGGPGARRVPPLRGCRSLVRTLTRPLPLLGGPAAAPAGEAVRLRVEADGAVLADLDRPVAQVTVRPDGGGLAQVSVRPLAAGTPVRARARTVSVYGPDFRYRADALVGGPVRSRTWTAMGGAWRLTLPRE
jgi:hypothetical protein